MKKFSAEYFEKKYRILFNKLFVKRGFSDTVKELRKKLEIPDNGFTNETDLACFVISKMNAEEQRSIAFLAFIEDYARKNNLTLENENKERIINA